MRVGVERTEESSSIILSLGKSGRQLYKYGRREHEMWKRKESYDRGLRCITFLSQHIAPFPHYTSEDRAGKTESEKKTRQDKTNTKTNTKTKTTARQPQDKTTTRQDKTRQDKIR